MQFPRLMVGLSSSSNKYQRIAIVHSETSHCQTYRRLIPHGYPNQNDIIVFKNPNKTDLSSIKKILHVNIFTKLIDDFFL